MIALPDIPEPWRDRYLPIENEHGQGWVAKAYFKPGAESLLFPAKQLFNHDNIVNWYNRKRNWLAEVKWPVPGTLAKTAVVKSYPSPSSIHDLRLRFGQPRAIRHWNNVWALNQRGINTPQPVMLEIPRSGNSGQGIVAVETMGAHSRLREILLKFMAGDSSVQIGTHHVDLSFMVETCGQYIREVHDKGVLHRDMSGGNILIPHSWDGTANNLAGQFFMVDINRIRFLPAASLETNLRIQDLERLHIPESHLERYFHSYCQGDTDLLSALPKFLKYRRAYRRIQATSNPVVKGLLKTITYWPRTG